MRNINKQYLYIYLFLILITFIGILISLTSLNKCPVTAEKSKHNRSEEYFLLVLILSAPNNNVERNSIRNTWASLKTSYINYGDNLHDMIYVPTYNEEGFLNNESVEKQKSLLENYRIWMTEKTKFRKIEKPPIKIKYVFTIGAEGLSSDQELLINNENESHKDIILISDFRDNYRQLSKKLIESIREVIDRYNFKYLLKCDDDTYVKLNLLSQDLFYYHNLVNEKYKNIHPPIELYWGYFNGRAQIKTHGQWKEQNFHLSKNYLPYALGGGYVISYNVAKIIYNNEHTLSTYVSEDISMGVWTAPYKNIHRRHDVRFDTAYMARKCANYHLVLHKRTAQDMYDIYNGNLCSFKDDTSVKRPKEYFYDWTKNSVSCCDNYV